MLNPEREARVIVVGFGEDFRIVRMGTQIEGYSTSCCSMRMASFKARNRPSLAPVLDMVMARDSSRGF